MAWKNPAVCKVCVVMGDTSFIIETFVHDCLKFEKLLKYIAIVYRFIQKTSALVTTEPNFPKLAKTANSSLLLSSED